MSGSVQFFEIHPLAELLNGLFTLHVYLHPNNTNFSVFLDRRSPFQTEAEALQAMGLLLGNESGLDLLRPLSRIDATALLVRALGLEDEQFNQTSAFADITNSNWGMPYANIAFEHGIVRGVGNNRFAPNELITANQFATLVLRASGLFGEFDWQQGVNMLIDQGIITEEDANTMNLFTRGDMAKIVYEAIQRGWF